MTAGAAGRLALVWMLLALLPCASASDVRGVTLRQAVATVTLGGVPRDAQVVLPYHWDRLHPGEAGTVSFEMVFPLAEVPDAQWALYVERLGNRYEIRLNGLVVAREGDADRDADFAKAPRWVSIPGGMLAPANRLQVVLDVDAGRRGGLAPVLVGPVSELRPVYRREMLGRVIGTQFVLVSSLLAAALSFMLWLTQVDADAMPGRRRDALYRHAWMAGVCYAFRFADTLIETPPLPWAVWNALGTAALGAWIGFVVLFASALVERVEARPGGWPTAMPWVAAASGAAAGWAAIALQRPVVLTSWQGAIALATSAFCLRYAIDALRRPAPMQRLVAAVLALNVLVGVRDWSVFRLSDAYGGNTWVRYSALLFGLVLAYIALRRFSVASAQARELLRTLSQRVAERESELARSYRQLAEVDREQARNAERTRILRDMHDTVGAGLASAIRQLQSGGAASGPLVLDTLRESLDGLRLSVDAMTVDPGDVGAMLANLRHRLGRRIEAAGFALDWDVESIEPVAGLDAEAMQGLQSLVVEAISNAMQHAGGRMLRVSADAPPGAVRIRVADDGRGFDAAARPPRALHARAAAIGARLTVDGRPGGASIEVVLQRER
jgi:signal transduction histidine kinase